MDHEEAFIAVFVAPEKRARYAEFLGRPKRKSEITNRFSHFFDFVPDLAKQVPRGVGSELAPLLRALGAGDAAYLIGGSDKTDGHTLPLEQAIDSALAAPGGVVVSCVAGHLALYVQEFPPGDTYILC